MKIIRGGENPSTPKSPLKKVFSAFSLRPHPLKGREDFYGGGENPSTPGNALAAPTVRAEIDVRNLTCEVDFNE